jgi:hypothetical protein
MPFCPTRPGAPADQYSSSKISQRTRSAPLPPYSTGQLTTDQWSAASSASHARWAANPSAVSRDGRAAPGTWAASHARASARKASSSCVKARSIDCHPSLTSVW